MAGPVRLSDAIIPEIFDPYVSEFLLQHSRLMASGVIVDDAHYAAQLAGGGRTFNMPFWRDLVRTEEDIMTDNPDDKAVPDGLGSSSEIACRMMRHKSWSTMDLVQYLAGSDPATEIAKKVGQYWVDRQETMALSGILGVLGSLGDEAGLNTDAKFVNEALIDALLVMGDRDDSLGAMWVHPVVYANMQKQKLIDFVAAPDTNIRVPTYNGRTVYRKTEGLAMGSGKYRTLITGTGVFRAANGPMAMPSEVSRDPNSGNGSGQEILHTRKHWGLHPNGFRFIDNPSNFADGGPSNAQLAAAGTWQKVAAERQAIKIVQLVTKEHA